MKAMLYSEVHTFEGVGLAWSEVVMQCPKIAIIAHHILLIPSHNTRV
jgi:hypothetical protein